MSQVITVAYKGRTVKYRYSASTRRYRLPGYVTSLRQLKEKLVKHFGKRSFDLYHVQKRRLCTITADRHLHRAMNRIPDGGSILIKAYKHY